MPKVIVNGQEIVVEDGATVIQACEQAGVEIPRFCYHEKLDIAGNCRMCLVEVEKSPKPIASCAHPCTDGMNIKTDTPMVKKAREGVMEFLLINHPLDCPICDQGGECDLQDQAMFYGKDSSRYGEEKRAVKDKDMGPLIKTHMTRCIHCTRCVRFIEDIAGTNELGAIGRGEDMEIDTYIEKGITSELSGNIIDLCPVGALTSKPFAFTARSWELQKTPSIDVLDAVGSNISLDSKGREVMRVTAIRNDSINEEWISDKIRFSYDGLKYQRLDRPYVRQDGKLKEVTFDEAISTIANKIKKSSPEKIGAIAGALTDVETMFAMKNMLSMMSCYNYDCREDGSLISNKSRSEYLFNTTIEGIEESDLCLIIGSNPRIEAPLINARIRKTYFHKNMKVALLGPKADLNYDYKHLGDNPWILKQIADGEHPFCKQLEAAKNPMLIIGSSVLKRSDYEAFLYQIKRMMKQYAFQKDDWNGFNVMHSTASVVGGLDVEFVPKLNGLSTKEMASDGVDILFLLGADEVTVSDKTFVIYIGHHGDKGAGNADVILPAAAFTEKSGIYVNTEGRPQITRAAVSAPGEAMSDVSILLKIARSIGLDLGYSNIDEVRKSLIQKYPVFAKINEISAYDHQIDTTVGKLKEFESDKISLSMQNFYRTDVISRASKTMAECSRELNKVA